MNDPDSKRGSPEEPAPAGPEEVPEAGHEEEIARLLRLAGPRPGADPERAERVRSAVHARWRAEVGDRRSRPLLRWIALPAAAAVVLAMISLARWLPRRSAGPDLKPAAMLERVQGPLRRSDGGNVTAGAGLPPGIAVSTAAGGRAAVTLSSGASLRLDSGTTLRLVSEAVLDLEEGAVYVDSGDARRDAVIVRTRVGAVRDVGTRFEVRLAESALHVTVREGLASLGSRTGDLEIPAGTRLTAGDNGEISRTPVPPHSTDWDWVLEIAPPLPLEGMTLGAFLAWVGRETGWEVRFTDAAAGEERSSIVLHGSLAGLRPDEAPAAILPTCGLTSHLEGSVLVIESLDATPGSR